MKNHLLRIKKSLCRELFFTQSKAVRTMQQTIQRLENTPNLQLLRTDYLE